MGRSLALAILLLVCSRFAHADATVNLCTSDDQPGPGTNLTSAVTAGGRITFTCGGAATILVNCTHQLSGNTQIDGGGNITLQGNARVPGCGASASAYSMFVNGSATRFSLRLSRLRVVGAKPKPDGPATTLSGGNVARGNLDLTLSDVTITNAYIPVLLDQGSVSVERSEISNSDQQAIIAPDIAISDHTKFVGNGGSPLESHGGHVAISDSQFDGNKQVSKLSSCTTVQVINSQFTNNIGDLEGGALRVNCNTQILHSTFANNRAESGGAVYIGDLAAHTYMADVEFDTNVASSDGGAVSMRGEVFAPIPPAQAVELHHVNFRGNRAPAGGALAVARIATPGTVLNPRILTGVAVGFMDNEASMFGGGLLVARADVRLSSAIFTGNRAVTIGGAVAGVQLGDGSIEFANSVLAKNVAPTGAAFAGNAATFINTTIADNDGPAVSPMSFVALLPIPAPAAGPQPIRFHNTIVSGGTAAACGPSDAAAPYQDRGTNLQYPGTSCAGSIAVGAPQFGPSYIPLPSSPAAHAGSDAVCAAAPVAGRDIWGTPRPSSGPHCAIGAAEADLQNMVEQALGPVWRGMSTLLRCSCSR